MQKSALKEIGGRGRWVRPFIHEPIVSDGGTSNDLGRENLQAGVGGGKVQEKGGKISKLGKKNSHWNQLSKKFIS